MASGRLDETRYGKEYKRRVTEVLREASVGLWEELEVLKMKCMEHLRN